MVFRSSSSAWLDTADCGKPKPQTTNLKTDFKLCTVTLRGEDFNVYKLLMNRRHELASRYNCMPYMIASNETLMKLANLKPCTVEELRECERKFIILCCFLNAGVFFSSGWIY